MEKQMFKVGVIGGGAAGMMAALSASRILSAGDVVLLEKNPMLGRKILATGNGRCNFSNRGCSWKDYGGKDLSLVRHAFEHLSPAQTVELFEELGVLAREESEGRLYPYSEQASSVADALQSALEETGVVIRLEREVTGVKKPEGKFVVEWDGGFTQVESLIIATGGKAGHGFGSTGDGYGFAKSFGHSLERPLPALVRVVTESGVSDNLKGVRAKGAVSLAKEKKLVAREEGEIQFTEDGLSGICIFNLSRILGDKPSDYSIQIDLFPGFSVERLLGLLESRGSTFGNRPAKSILEGMLHSRLIPIYLELSGVDASSSTCQVDDEKLLCLARLLKCREVAVKATKGWKEAQVTVGGVKGEEVYGETLESKIVPGLFFAGEVLDVDGKCGGWNLQWAWSSGWTAGKHAALFSLQDGK
jgi:predicted Rossmann fold flavoprotein